MSDLDLSQFPFKYARRVLLTCLVVGVCLFTGFAIVQNTMAFRMQDVLGLTGIETARTFGIGMILVAVFSLFSQMILVQMLELKPFSLLRLAIPMLIVGFYIMAFYDTEAMLLGTALYTVNPTYPFIFSLVVYCFLLAFVLVVKE